MADHPRSKIGLGALAGALAGAGVGLLDGARVASGQGGVRVLVATALLAASVDALAGLLAGAAVEVGCRLAVWGRAARAPLAARIAGNVAAGAGAAVAA